jgi:integrase
MGTIEPYETAQGRRYRVRYRTPDRRQTSKRGFRTKRDAEQYLAGVEVSKVRGEWRDPSRARITLQDLAREWLAAQVQLKATTLSGYTYSLEAHVLPRWGTWRLSDITHGAVQTWVNELAATKAPSTARQIHLVLAGMLKYAVRDGRLAVNPCDEIQLPRLRKGERGYLTHEQVARLAAACDKHGDVIRFLAYTGLRWGEMAALRVARLDMLRRRVSVVESVSEVGGRLVWGTPKTQGSRSVPFPRLLEDDLARRCADKQAEDLVFGSAGVAIRNNNFRRRVFAPAIAELRESDPNFPEVTPHDLRHTAASLAIAAGANVKAVQRMLGHASAAMTLDVYADLFDDDLDAVAVALDEHASAAVVSKMWPREAGELRQLP